MPPVLRVFLFLLIPIALPGCGVNKHEADQTRSAYSHNANMRISVQEFPEAISWAQKALALAEKTHGKNSVEAAEELILLAECKWEAGELGEAEEALARAETILNQQAKASIWVIHVWKEMGKLEEKRRNYDAAIRHYATTGQIAKKLENNGGFHEWVSLVDIAEVHQKREDLDRASLAFQQAHELILAHPKSGSVEGRNQVFLMHSVYAVYRRAYQEAQKSLDEIKASSKDFSWQEKKFQKTLEMLEEMLPLLLAAKNANRLEGEEYSRLCILAFSFDFLGFKRQAIPFLKEQLEIAKKLFGMNADKQLVRIHLEIADCFSEVENWKAAGEQINQAVALLKGFPADLDYVPDLMVRAGVASYDARQYAEGARWLENGLREKKERKDELEERWISALLGSCYAKLGQKEKAEEVIRGSLESSALIKDSSSPDLIFSLLVIAETELDLGKPREALARFEQCRDLLNAMEESSAKKKGMLKVRYGMAQATKKLEESSRENK